MNLDKRQSEPAAGRRSRRLPRPFSSLFDPGPYWGAEFLRGEVRLAAARPAEGGVIITETFRASPQEAEDFARRRALRYRGLLAAVSHLPYRIHCLGPAELSEPDPAEEEAEIERLKPPGSKPEDIDAQIFRQGGMRLLALTQEAALLAFFQDLPPALGTLRGLTLSPLPLLEILEWDLGEEAAGEKAVGKEAAGEETIGKEAAGEEAAVLLQPEEEETHCLFLAQRSLRAHVKLQRGIRAAREDGEGTLADFRKALIYYWETKAPGLPLRAAYLACDGEGGEFARLLERLGLPIRQMPVAPWLAEVPPPLRAAAAMARWHALGAAPRPNLSGLNAGLAQNRRQWLYRSRRLWKAGWSALLALGVSAAALGLLGGGLGLYNQSRMRSHAGELDAWQQAQARKARVEAELLSLAGVLEKRSRVAKTAVEVARALPEGVWLKSWEMERGAGGRAMHTLQGYGLEEAGVGTLLAALEKRGFSSVKLKSTEMVPGKKVVKETGIRDNDRDLTAFRIVLWE